MVNEILQNVQTKLNSLSQLNPHLQTSAQWTEILAELKGLSQNTQRQELLLETVAALSDAASSILEVDDLLRVAVNLIRDYFDFYHAGIFLVDEGHEWALLRAAAGEFSQPLLEKQWHLKISDGALVSQCIFYRQPRIALRSDEARHSSLLPKTQSQIALPLINRGQVIGALDLQSSEAADFSENDISLFQTLADQLANSIQNAQLFSENTRLLEQAENNRRFLKTVIEHIPDPIFIKDKNHSLLEMNQANAQVIGLPSNDLLGKTDRELFSPELAERFHRRDSQVFATNQILEAEDKTVWADGQEHTAYTRLIPIPNPAGQPEYMLGISHDVTERRAQEAERERLLAETAALYLGGQAIAKALSERQVFEAIFEQIQRSNPCEFSALRFSVVENEPIWAEVRFNWQKNNNPTYAVGTRFYLRESAQRDLLTGGRSLFIDDISTDDRLSAEERASLIPTGACSVAILPLMTGNQLLGVILVYFTSPHTFTEDTQRVWLAMTDQVCIALINRRLIEEAAYRATRVEAAAEVARAASSILEVQELLNSAVALICDRFELYYVGAFLVDEAQEWAVLKAGTGEAGQIQLKKQHRLKIGGESMIGWSIAHRQPRIALDVGKEAVRFQNPDLPKTRSEIALPLIYHNELIGALTVQSAEQAAFSREDIIVLQTMADQLANAVKNAQLYEQAQQELAERKKAEGALRASEALYQSLVDNIPQNILRKDREGRFVFGNKSFCKILGVSLNELVGKTDFDYYPPEAAAKYRQDDQRILETGEIFETVEENLLPTGNKKYVRVVKSPIFDSAGEVVGTQGIFWDITERKQAEEALRQSEERFRAIFDSSPIPIVISRLSDGTILQANEHLARLFGLSTDLSPDQLVGQQTPNFYNSPADREKVLESLKQEGYIRNHELQVKKADGTLFWVLVSLQLMTLKGEPAILAGFYDLTDRKQAEDALQKALARTQLLYNISEALATLINQRAAFETVLGEYLLLLNVSRGGIILVDTAGEYISLEASYVDNKVVEPDLVLPLKEDIIIQYLQQHPFPLIINDVSANPLTQHNPTLQEQVEAILFVPIVSRGQVIGTISAGATPKNHVFTTEDIEIGKAIADQLAIWLDNHLLLTEAQYRSERLQTAAEVSRAASSILDVNELIETSVNLIRDQFDFYYVGLFLVDEAREWAILRAGTGKAGRIQLENNHKLKIGGGSMIGWCVQNRHARIALDVGQEAVRFQNPHLPDTHSEMALPLVSRDEVIGALTVQSTERGAFSAEDITQLQTMADHLANAIQNARLFESVIQAQLEAEELLQETQALQLFSQMLAGTLQVNEILNIFFRACIDVLGFEYGVFSLVDKYQNRIKAIAGFGVSDSQIKRANRSLDSQDIMADIIRTGKTEVITGWDERFDRDMFEAEGHAQWVRVFTSVTLRQENMGLVETGFNQDTHKRIDESQIRLLRAFIDQTALALDNAQRYEASQKAAHRETLIKEITTKVRASTNVDTILQTTVKELGDALGSKRAYVHLISPTNGEKK